MQHITGRHWAVVAAFLAGFGASLASLPGWGEALSPLFIGGALVQVSALVGALFTEKPRQPWDGADRRGGRL